MGNKVSVKKIGFEDIQYIFRSNKDHIIISTLSESEQDCIIKNTVTPESEVELINRAIGKTSLDFFMQHRNFEAHPFSQTLRPQNPRLPHPWKYLLQGCGQENNQLCH